MAIQIGELLSYFSPLVFGALVWLWKLDSRLTVMRMDIKTEMHALENALRADTVPMDEFRKLEARLEKRLDRTDGKLDEVLGGIRRITPPFSQNGG